MLRREPSVLEYLSLREDTQLWVRKGSGKLLNTNMACVLGRSMLSGIGASYLRSMAKPKDKKEFLERYKDYFDFDKEPNSLGHLRFGHAESILPLLSLLVGMGGRWDVGISISA